MDFHFNPTSILESADRVMWKLNVIFGVRSTDDAWLSSDVQQPMEIIGTPTMNALPTVKPPMSTFPKVQVLHEQCHE